MDQTCGGQEGLGRSSAGPFSRQCLSVPSFLSRAGSARECDSLSNPRDKKGPQRRVSGSASHVQSVPPPGPSRERGRAAGCLQALEEKGPRGSELPVGRVGGTPADHTQGEEKVEGTLYCPGAPRPKSLDPGTMAQDLLPVEPSLDLSHHLPFFYVPKMRGSSRSALAHELGRQEEPCPVVLSILCF